MSWPVRVARTISPLHVPSLQARPTTGSTNSPGPVSRLRPCSCACSRRPCRCSSAAVRPSTSCTDQPYICSAARFHEVMAPSWSQVMIGTSVCSTIIASRRVRAPSTRSVCSASSICAAMVLKASIVRSTSALPRSSSRTPCSPAPTRRSACSSSASGRMPNQAMAPSGSNSTSTPIVASRVAPTTLCQAGSTVACGSIRTHSVPVVPSAVVIERPAVWPVTPLQTANQFGATARVAAPSAPWALPCASVHTTRSMPVRCAMLRSRGAMSAGVPARPRSACVSSDKPVSMRSAAACSWRSTTWRAKLASKVMASTSTSAAAAPARRASRPRRGRCIRRDGIGAWSSRRPGERSAWHGRGQDAGLFARALAGSSDA